MSDPFLVLGWALRWHQHTCISNTTPNQNPPRYSNDYKTVRELIYDEWAEYTFHIRVQRLDPHYKLVIKGELLREKEKTSVFLSKNGPTDSVDSRKPWVGLDPAPDHSDKKDYFECKLFCPSVYKTCHPLGSTQKFRFTIGWKSIDEADQTHPTFGKPMDTIQIFITDVIPKN
jgi:hypothetical protein